MFLHLTCFGSLLLKIVFVVSVCNCITWIYIYLTVIFHANQLLILSKQQGFSNLLLFVPRRQGIFVTFISNSFLFYCYRQSKERNYCLSWLKRTLHCGPSNGTSSRFRSCLIMIFSHLIIKSGYDMATGNIPIILNLIFQIALNYLDY